MFVSMPSRSFPMYGPVEGPLLIPTDPISFSLQVTVARHINKFAFSAVLAQFLKLNFITSNGNECSPVLHVPYDLAMAVKFTSKQEQKM